MNRNNAIDIAKGLGIFIVLWGHTYCPFKPYLYVFHMPVFFLLSGFVFNNRDGIKDTLKKKVRSLCIPFFFFLIFQRIGFILIALIGGTFNPSYLLIWTPIYPWGTVGVLWFFISLFTVSVVFSMVNKLPSELYRFFACLLMTYMGYLLSNNDVHLPLRLGSSLSMMFFFYVGNKLSSVDLDKIGHLKTWMLLSLASLALYVVCLNLYLPIIDVSLNVFRGAFFLSLGIMILGCVMIVIFGKLFDYIPYFKTGMAYIGRNSLTIFTTHTVILEAIYLVFPRDNISTFGGILIAFFMLGACLPLIILLKKCFPFVFGIKKAVSIKV